MSDNSSPLRRSSSASSGGSAGSARSAGSAGSASSGGGSGSEGTSAGRKAGAQGSRSSSGTRLSGTGASGSGFRFVDHYGLLVCLGEGGMGEVWAARDPKAPKNRVVALKLTKQQGAEAAKVLWDEARIASLIDHPNVCRVHELGMADGLQYLVMDYCDGASLHDLLERLPGRTLAPAYAARILANVSAGLHAAHELCDESGAHMGVVHRDVSPQNVLISTAGGITVADFGVARAAGQAHKATETGEMKGKLSYMAPEQVTSRDIDRRVDVFALGCVLYQVTLGKRPFHGEDALATLYQLLEKDLVRPSELDPAYPQELEAVVLKALAKDRNERFATAHDLQMALEHFLVASGQQVTDGDVARLLLERMGTEISARKEEIRRRSAALESGARIPASASERLETEAGTVSEAPPPARTSWGVRLAAASIFLAIAGGSLFMLRERREPASATPERSVDARSEQVRPASTGADVGPSSTTTASSAAKADTRLTVVAQPRGAKIELDGREVGTGEYRGTHAASADLHRLLVTAPGYEPEVRELNFLESQSLEIALRRSTVSRPPAAQPTAPAKPSATSGSPNGKKPPRALDSTNPFANP